MGWFDKGEDPDPDPWDLIISDPGGSGTQPPWGVRSSIAGYRVSGWDTNIVNLMLCLSCVPYVCVIDLTKKCDQLLLRKHTWCGGLFCFRSGFDSIIHFGNGSFSDTDPVRMLILFGYWSFSVNVRILFEFANYLLIFLETLTVYKSLIMYVSLQKGWIRIRIDNYGFRFAFGMKGLSGCYVAIGSCPSEAWSLTLPNKIICEIVKTVVNF